MSLKNPPNLTIFVLLVSITPSSLYRVPTMKVKAFLALLPMFLALGGTSPIEDAVTPRDLVVVSPRDLGVSPRVVYTEEAAEIAKLDKRQCGTCVVSSPPCIYTRTYTYAHKKCGTDATFCSVNNPARKL